MIKKEKKERQERQERQEKQIEDTNEEIISVSESQILDAVEKIIDKKMETINMIIESKVNQKIRDYKRWIGLTKNAGFFPSSNLYKNQNSDSTNIPASSNNIASVSSNKINYANFGTENYRYITLNTVCQLIKTITDFHAIFQKIIKELYFNVNHKENSVVFIHPNSYKTMTIFVDGMWRNFDQSYVLENIVRRANDVLQHFMINSVSEEEMLKKEIGKKRFEHLQTFTDQVDNIEDYPEFRKKILEDTEHTIVTNQHLVHPSIYEPETTPTTV